MSNCRHEYLSFDVIGSVKALYRTPDAVTIRDALKVQKPARKKIKRTGNETPSTQTFALPDAGTFPAPVRVPGDLLFDEPDYPPQTVQECLNVRNKVTNARRTVYVVAPPSISPEVGFLEDCTKPLVSHTQHDPDEDVSIDPPTIEQISSYLQAFYHGLPVKQIASPSLSFTVWKDNSSTKRPPRKAKPQRLPSHISLSTPTTKTRIRCRPPKDKTFRAQLDLNDLLDVAISILPPDAYALLMLTNHDLYEDDEDDFCCGRAYGGSRVAVVSTARYNPGLDEAQKVNREHSWPGSHCMTWLVKQHTGKALASRRMTPTRERNPGSAVVAAVLVENDLPLASSPADLSALWLGRVAKLRPMSWGIVLGWIIACTMLVSCKVRRVSLRMPGSRLISVRWIWRSCSERQARPRRSGIEPYLSSVRSGEMIGCLLRFMLGW